MASRDSLCQSPPERVFGFNPFAGDSLLAARFSSRRISAASSGESFDDQEVQLGFHVWLLSGGGGLLSSSQYNPSRRMASVNCSELHRLADVAVGDVIITFKDVLILLR